MGLAIRFQCFLALCLCLWLAPEIRAAGQDFPLHIGVLARRLDREPITDLKSKDFEVTADGNRLGVSAIQPDFSRNGGAQVLPVHVLLMVSVDSEYAAEQALVNLLRKELPPSFGDAEVAICRRDGVVTRYVGTRDALEAELRGFHNRRVRFSEAVAELNTFTGRRVVLYLTEKGVRVPTPIRRMATRSAAIVYQIGGSNWDNYVQGGELSTPAVPFEQGGPMLWDRTDMGGIGVLPPRAMYDAVWIRSIRDVVVERTLKRAFHNVQRDGAAYYDLSLNVPAGTAALDLKIKVKGDYQVTAQAYSETKGAALPDVRLPKRQ